MVIFLCFVLDKNILGFDGDVVLLCAYIPPENSTYYDLYDNGNGISILEDILTDVLLSLDDVYLLLCGGLNG